jgi:hypothetical protein
MSVSMSPRPPNAIAMHDSSKIILNRLLSILFLQTLQTHQLAVAALQRQQLGVGAALYHLALLNHIDDIGILNGAQAVGDGYGRPALGRLIQRVLDHLLGLGV